MRFALLLAVFALCCAIFPPAIHAQSGLPPAPYAYRQLDDPVQEAAARNLMAELRCLVCQGQSIADSDAPLAGDMRSDVRERIAAGERPAEIRQWLIDRYGNWVTYDPPIEGDTIALYVLPLLALLGGLFIVIRRLRPAKQGDGAP